MWRDKARRKDRDLSEGCPCNKGTKPPSFRALWESNYVCAQSYQSIAALLISPTASPTQSISAARLRPVSVMLCVLVVMSNTLHYFPRFTQLIFPNKTVRKQFHSGGSDLCLRPSNLEGVGAIFHLSQGFILLLCQNKSLRLFYSAFWIFNTRHSSGF